MLVGLSACDGLAPQAEQSTQPAQATLGGFALPRMIGGGSVKLTRARRLEIDDQTQIQRRVHDLGCG